MADEFKDRLKYLRKEKNLYQKDLAKIIGVSDGAVGMYEIGKRMPDKEILLVIANYFNVSFDYLLGRSKERQMAEEIIKDLAEKPEIINLSREIVSRDNLYQLLQKSLKMNPKELNKLIKIIEILEG